MPETESFQIPSRFCGPPNSGNGGYVAGRLAQRMPRGEAVVRLHRPPPLETELRVHATDTGLELRAGGSRVATATPDVGPIEPLFAPGFDAATAASRAFRGFDEHTFPGCFVCGPERGEGDGLRIFPGPLPETQDCAGPWIPDASLGDANGRVAPEVLWAALDCPGALAFEVHDAEGALLGELRARLFGHVQVGERCTLVARELSHERRKHTTLTTLFGEDGSCRGASVGIWIEMATG